jgi:hypothetical protein
VPTNIDKDMANGAPNLQVQLDNSEGRDFQLPVVGDLSKKEINESGALPRSVQSRRNRSRRFEKQKWRSNSTASCVHRAMRFGK